jgi:hypothetical protein
MSEWITDRLPTVEDAVHYCVLLWDQDEGVLIWSYDGVNEGQPWMPIPTPAPYVKPKRWTFRKSRFEGSDNWLVFRDGELIHTLAAGLTHDAAQRIADVYNEVMP